MSVEPFTRRRVTDRGQKDLDRRVTALEGQVAAMQTAVDKVASDTSEILSVLTAAKGVTGFFKKHGPRMIAFGTGIAVSAGFVDPKVGAFIRGFFGM